MSWRRILLLSIALVLVVAATTWSLLQNSNVATDFVRRGLQKLFVTPVALAETTIELEAGRLRIEGLEIRDPTAPERALVRVQRGSVDVQLDPFGAGVAPRQVVIEGLELEAGPALPTAELLLRANLGGGQAPQGTLALPAVQLRSGRATLHVTPGEPPLVLDELQVEALPLRDDASKLQLRGAAKLIEPAATLQVRGEVDVRSGAAVLSISTAGVDCSQQVVANLARLARVRKDDLDIDGQITSLRVTCHVPPRDAADRRPRLEIEAQCSKVRLDTPRLPPIVRDADVQLYVDTADGGLLEASFEQRSDKGMVQARARVTALIEAEGAAPRVEVRASGRDLVIDEELRAALQSFPVGARVVAGLEPTAGIADLELYLLDPHVPGNPAEIDIKLRDVAMSYHGFGPEDRKVAFPLPLEHGEGTVTLRDNLLVLRDVRAEIAASAGGGEVALRGQIHVQRGRGRDSILDIEGRGLAFRDDLRGAIAALLRDEGALYDKLAPSGRADVSVSVRPPELLPGGFSVDVSPRGAAMRWEGFPYRIEDLRGRIRVDRRGARFQLSGKHEDGGLTMQGRIPIQKQHAPEDGFEAVVEVDGLAIDEELLAGVAVVVPELEAPWRSAAPSGRLSGAVKVWRPSAETPLSHDVRLQLDDVDLSLPVSPWRARGLTGQVLVQGVGPEARIDVDSLRGELHDGVSRPAKLALLGHLESGAAAARDLTFVVRELELSEQLGASLDERDALDQPTWDSLRPSGTVDLVARERFDASADDRNDLDLAVHLVDVRSDARMLPRPAEQMTGELRIHEGRLTFRDVRAVLGGARVRCTNGRVEQVSEQDRRTAISLDVFAEDFPVDDGLANLFTGPLRESVLQRELRGKVDVDGLKLRFLVPGPDDALPFATTIGGMVTLDELDVLLGAGGDGLRIEGLQGQVTLAESTVDAAGGALSGALSGGALRLLGHPFDSIESTFTADAERIRVHTLNARVHDGELRHARPDAPALEYALPAAATPTGRLAADLEFERVDVFSLLSTSGWSNPPYRGFASGDLKLLRLDGNNVGGAEAEGSLQVTRADLGKVPLFAAIYAQLPPADRPRFNELDTKFRLDGEALIFDQLDVRSDILAVQGAGTLELDGYLDVKMELDSLLGVSADPVLMRFINYLAKNLVSFRLYGHLRDLRASTELLGSSAPERRDVLPMPPARVKPKPPGY
ncbi:MAG: hypothetical protein VXY92_13535 [Planctomycetota bacterium]|nr:hypothetical protein [Planctomycetota bacterium]